MRVIWTRDLLNRIDLQKVSQLRRGDARALLNARRYAAAYYLVGYSVECALKACIAKQIKRHDFPDKKIVIDAHTHDLEKLVRLAGLVRDLEKDLKRNPAFAINWTVTKGLVGNKTVRSRHIGSPSERFILSLRSAKARRSRLGKAKMVGKLLNKELIDAGAELVQRLDDKGLRPDAAFWLYSSETQSWRLFLAEAKLPSAGPKHVYRNIQKVMKDVPEDSRILGLSDIGLLRSDAPLIKSLRTAIKTSHGISGIRVTNSVVNGNLIEDAYIYRVA